MTNTGRNVPVDQKEVLAGNYEELLRRQRELLEAANRAPTTCDSDEIARKLTDFVGQLAAAIAKARDAHRIEKEPHLRAGQAVDRFFGDIRDPLDVFKKLFERLIGDWQFRKQEAARLAALELERVAREGAERLAAAAMTDADLDDAIAQEDEALMQAAIAAARPLERSRIHGDLATGSLRTTYSYTLVDLTKVPLKFLMLNDSAVKKHIAASQQDKEPDPVPGLTFIPQHLARIRA